MFLTYVITAGKREVLRLCFKHIHVLLLFLAVPGKLRHAVKVHNFGHIHYLTPGPGQFDISLTYVVKAD